MVGSWVVSCLLTAGHEHLDRDKWLPARHLTVVAIVGIGGAMLGVPALDPLAGICVATLVSWMGLRIGARTLPHAALVARAPPRLTASRRRESPWTLPSTRRLLLTHWLWWRQVSRRSPS